jgi:hypothetical protein
MNMLMMYFYSRPGYNTKISTHRTVEVFLIKNVRAQFLTGFVIFCIFVNQNII